MSLPTNFFIGRGGGGGSLYDFEEIYMQPSSPSGSSDLQQGWNSLAYFSNPNGTTPSATIAATTATAGTSLKDVMEKRGLTENDVIRAAKTYNPTGGRDEFIVFSSGGQSRVIRDQVSRQQKSFEFQTNSKIVTVS